MTEDVIKGLVEENEILRLAICGGEDAPGYAASLSLAEILAVAKENERRPNVYRDAISALTADRERLREALEPVRRAHGRYVEVCRNWQTSGETEAERRFSEGECVDTAREAAFEVLCEMTFEQMSALSALSVSGGLKSKDNSARASLSAGAEDTVAGLSPGAKS